MYARSLASSLVLALAGLFLLATPSAQAQAFVDSYYNLNQGNSIPLTAFDSSRDRVVIASLREISSFKNDIALDITIKNPFQIARTYVYTAPFLDSKNGRVEIADLVADDNAYVVFFNKSADSRTRWSSWALRLDPSNLHVVWGRQLTVSGDPDEFVRVRDAVSLGTSWAMVAALDNELIDAETAVVRIDGAGTVLWSNSYALTKDAELFTLSYGPQGLVAGGWVSDVLADDVAAPVVLQLETHSGQLTNAVEYVNVRTEFTLAMTQDAGPYGSSASLFLGGQIGGGGDDAVFWNVDSYLNASYGTRIPDVSYFMKAIDLTAAGDLVAIEYDYTFGDRLLTVPGPHVTGTGTPFLSDLSASYAPATVKLTSLSSALGAVQVGGVQTQDSSTILDPVVLAHTSPSGALDSCVPTEPLAPRILQFIESLHLEGSTHRRQIGLEPYPFQLVNLGSVVGTPLCPL